MNGAPDCYACKFRREILGSCHSQCVHPKVSPADKSIGPLAFMIGAPGITTCEGLKVTGNAHGIRKGWFYWPLDFDPVWLESCDGFEANV